MVVHVEENDMECEDCGVVSDDVKETRCPYAWEVYDNDVTVSLCKNCYKERLYEV